MHTLKLTSITDFLATENGFASPAVSTLYPAFYQLRATVPPSYPPMPKHLEELQLSKEAQDLTAKLDAWLAKNGQYKPAADMKYFDECVVSEGSEREILALGAEAVKPITNVILLPKNPYSVLTIE